MDSPSDKALMLRVKHGDLDMLGILFDRHHRRLYSFFYRLTQQADLSEDLVQGVFERMLKFRETYSGEGDFLSWMFRIARNLHVDVYRKQKRQLVREQGVECDALESGSEPEEDIDHWLVRQAMQKLDPDKKKVLILSRFEGFRYREIAEIMDCTENTVKIRAFRALQDLRGIITTLRKQEKL
ncbi:MAG: RNA polymerase sigma factor [Balneolales bacterium]|nr:RNA polymerase sigma factor [Balneolales bacterium]